MNKNKILVIGPKPPPLGGARIAFDLLCKKSELFSGKYDTKFINIPLVRKKMIKNFFLRLIMLIHILLKVPFYKFIILHSSANFLFQLGPLIINYAKFFNNKIQIRFFGSRIDLLINKKPKIKKSILKADQILLETKGLINFFKEESNHKGLIWFPNSRKFNNKKPKFSNKLNKIIYVGQLKEEKGTIDLINAFELLNNKITNIELHLVGQIMDESITEIIKDNSKIIYHGILPNSVCQNLISQSDLFVYPSKYESEGYPGVILEAMSFGKPVIVSKWRFLNELVEEDYNGKLFDINSPVDIKDKIEFYIKNDLKLMEHSKNSYEFSKKFDSDHWNKNIYNDILSVFLNKNNEQN